MKNIAIGYSLLGNEEKGITIVRNEAKLAKNNFGENSVEYHQSLMALADSLKHFGRHREACQYFRVYDSFRSKHLDKYKLRLPSRSDDLLWCQMMSYSEALRKKAED